MKKTVIIYGSTTGTCEGLANKIAAELGAMGAGSGAVDVINVNALNGNIVAGAENLLLGTSTWGSGGLQDDWYDAIESLKTADLSGKTVAIFGCGDSLSYPDTFCGGMAELYNAAKAAGATIVGAVPTDGYTYLDSAAIIDGQFVGLPLDEDNESSKTDDRIAAWVAQILPQL